MTEQKRIEEFREMAAGVFHEKQVTDLVNMGFFQVPASVSYHGNYEGGLYMHSKLVYSELKAYTERLNLNWQACRSPFVIAFLHDLCKVDDYVLEDGEYVFNKKRIFAGHGEKSVMMAIKLFPDITDEEIACIRYHMGAYEGKEKWKVLGSAIRKYPNILWTHQADMVASQVFGL